MQGLKRNRWFKQLTPQMAWEQYVGTSVELFISNFRADGIIAADGITGLEEACQFYAKELPEESLQLFTPEQIDLIGKLLTEHANNYIKKRVE